MKSEDSSAGYWWLAPVFVVVLPFVPLLLAGVESLLFHTGRVEDFCRAIGIHDELSKLYEVLFSFLR